MICILLSLAPLWGEPPSKSQILYLVQAGELERGIALYKEREKHDFSTLEQIGSYVLAEGARSPSDEDHLLSMYGAGIANSCESMVIYEIGMKSRNPMAQMATIQFLSQMEEDRAEELLTKAFHSPFLPVRMEAAYALARKQSPRATGIIEGLMQKLPRSLRIYFPELFAMIGSPSAGVALRRLAKDHHLFVRLAALHTAAKYGRDDFLTEVRAGITHPDAAEQETCAMALGTLRDSHSIPKLKELTASTDLSVHLTACHSLTLLGEHSFWAPILKRAEEKHLFAIPLLAPIPDANRILFPLLKDYDASVRVNAALTLLSRRESRALPVLLKLLTRSDQDFGLLPTHSLGHSLMAFQVIPSAAEYGKEKGVDVGAITLSVRENILRELVEMPEEIFLEAARHIFDQRVHDLLPLLIALLENMGTPEAITLLQAQSRRAGAPFIRAYAHLALYRLQVEGPHEAHLTSWIEAHKLSELIRFRPMLSWTEREDLSSPYLLTPEETSRLLIESLDTLAARGKIDLLLDVMATGHHKNRYVLAGLLLKAIQ